MLAHDYAQIRLAPGTHAIVREPTTLQFGIDATRCGLIELDQATEVASIIEHLRQPHSVKQAVAKLTRYLDEDQARSLLSDLIEYRILIPPVRGEVLLLGNSALARTLKSMLTRSNITAISPEKKETEVHFLRNRNPLLPLVVVDKNDRSSEIMSSARSRFGPILPVTLLDTRGIVGPLSIGLRGPCLVCTALHHQERDPLWPKLAQKLPTGPLYPDPVVLEAVALSATIYIRKLCGIPAAPGITSQQPQIGERITIDPFHMMTHTREILAMHPDCPLCF